jgi:hypothetical protein
MMYRHAPLLPSPQATAAITPTRAVLSASLKMQKIDVKLAFMKEIRILVVTESRGIRIEAGNLLQPADDPVRNCGRELRANKGFKFASKRFQIMAPRSWQDCL